MAKNINKHSVEENMDYKEPNIFYMFQKDFERYTKKKLSSEEESVLLERFQKGDQTALDILIQHNLAFAVYKAKIYYTLYKNIYPNLQATKGDFINEAYLGMRESCTAWKKKNHIRFIVYAERYIKNAIKNMMAREGISISNLPISFPSATTIRKLKVFEEKMDKHYHDPIDNPIEEIVSNPIISLQGKERLSCKQKILRIQQLYELLNANIITDVEEIMHAESGTDDGLIRVSLEKDIERVLNSLSYKEKEIVTKYFGILGEEKKSLEEIGLMVNLSEERIRQILKKAIKRLQYKHRSSLLEEYLSLI